MNTRHGRALIFIVIFVYSVSCAAFVSAQPRASVLAVFAHPDDEITIGPLLAHYAAKGARITLVVVTSGQKGVSEHAKIPAGEGLGRIREEESRAACRAYGIEPPIFFGEQDGALGSMERDKQIVARLREIIGELKPSVVITWGADGLTGHADHRAVGNLVTEVFQMWQRGARDRSDRYAPQKLYYVAYPLSIFAGRVPPFPEPLRSVDDDLITTIVEAGDGLSAAARAEAEYKSQHRPEVMKAINGMMAEVLKGRIYLRLALSRTGKSIGRERDIFENLR